MRPTRYLVAHTKRRSQWMLRRLGWELHRVQRLERVVDPVETSPRDEEIYNEVRPFTMTSRLRVMALISAVRYLVRNEIPGDLVECGVWRGGSAMAMALALMDEKDTHRAIWLYDTFAGMTTPTTHDVDPDGIPAIETYAARGGDGQHSDWCFASLPDVEANVSRTGFPRERLRYVVGDVQQTLPVTHPSSIGLLRLDTDWYESTRTELDHLYPRLQKHGVCIIDDYGHWAGARRAVDEYVDRLTPRPLINRIDYTGRSWVKV